ncbi:MAG: molybdenum cofactor guanylyltransferase [Spirochaetaceae bacterium]|nr:MAG: molybdenum cofactor guanylyltransferase [Spirochaetaceae bacterium]
MIPPVSAAIVAGGASSRMGSPKGLLEYDGKPFLTRILDVLETLSEDLICVTCRPEEYDFEKQRLRFVPDYGGEPRGPLSGIMGALSAARHPLCIVVAVDMPFLNGRVLGYLAEQAEGVDAVLPVIEGDRLECLHAVYRDTCLPHGEEALLQGRLRVSRFLSDLKVKRVTAADLGMIGEGTGSFENINTPEQWISALRGTGPG